MRRFLLAAFAALVLSACDNHDSYDFQPEDKDRACGVVTYNDPDEDNGDVPIGRYCATKSGKR